MELFSTKSLSGTALVWAGALGGLWKILARGATEATLIVIWLTEIPVIFFGLAEASLADRVSRQIQNIFCLVFPVTVERLSPNFDFLALRQ